MRLMWSYELGLRAQEAMSRQNKALPSPQEDRQHIFSQIFFNIPTRVLRANVCTWGNPGAAML